MSTSNQTLKPPQHLDDCESLLNDLLLLLHKQIELAQQGRITAVEALCEKAQLLVREIAHARILDMPGFNQHRKHLKKLYEQLALALSAHKAQAEQELSHIRKGRKTIATYRGNI